MSMYYRKKTKRATGAARGFKSTGMGSRKQYIANLKATPAAYTARLMKNRTFVKGAIAPYGGQKELKYVDSAKLTLAADASAGTITCLNLIAVGDDNTTRDGRQVCIKSVQVRGIIRPEDTDTTSSYCRVMLVWDNAVNSGGLPSITSILTALDGTAFPLIDNTARFTVLSDQAFAMNGTGEAAGWGSDSTQKVDIYKKIDQVTQFSGTTAAIGSIQNGALYLITLGTNTSGTAATVVCRTRVRFTDP